MNEHAWVASAILFMAAIPLAGVGSEYSGRTRLVLLLAAAIFAAPLVLRLWTIAVFG